jgi:hypothetical protein
VIATTWAVAAGATGGSWPGGTVLGVSRLTIDADETHVIAVTVHAVVPTLETPPVGYTLRASVAHNLTLNAVTYLYTCVGALPAGTVPLMVSGNQTGRLSFVSFILTGAETDEANTFGISATDSSLSAPSVSAQAGQLLLTVHGNREPNTTPTTGFTWGAAPAGMATVGAVSSTLTNSTTQCGTAVYSQQVAANGSSGVKTATTSNTGQVGSISILVKAAPVTPGGGTVTGTGFIAYLQKLGGLTHFYALDSEHTIRDSIGGKHLRNQGAVMHSSQGAVFNGSPNSFLEASDDPSFSIAEQASQGFTVLAFMTVTDWTQGTRDPRHSGYTHWIGKASSFSNTEWLGRHYYSPDMSGEVPSRAYRTSFYAFNPTDEWHNNHLGAGSYNQVQSAAAPAAERMLAGTFNTTTTTLPDGSASPAYPGQAHMNFNGGAGLDTDGFNGPTGQYKVHPQRTSAPFRIGGVHDDSRFIGVIRRVAIFNRQLSDADINGIYSQRGLPDGLVTGPAPPPSANLAQPLTDVLALEIADDPYGLTNLVANPSGGGMGGWGWITPVTGTAMSGEGAAGSTNLRYDAVAGVANYFTTEALPVTAGNYAAASWYNVAKPNTYWHRASLEFLDVAGAVLSSSPQTPYAQSADGVQENLPPALIPAGTTKLRLRFDFYTTNAGANPTAAVPMGLRQVMVAQAANIADLVTIRVNLVPNPSFETDLKGWTSTVFDDTYSLATAARSTAQAYSGAASMLVTWPTSYFAWMHTTSLTGLAVGATYTFSAYVRVPSGSPDVYLHNEDARSATTSVKDQWTRLSFTFVASAITQYFGVEARNPSAGQQCYVDAVMLEKSTTVGAYFDGTTPSGGGWIYAPTTRTDVVTRTNLVKNPSFEANTTDWAAFSSVTTISRSTTAHLVGTASLRLAISTGAKTADLRVVTATAARSAVVAGKSYSVSVGFFFNTVWGPANDLNIAVHWYDAAGNEKGAGTNDTIYNVAANAWNRFTISRYLTAPPGAVTAGLTITAGYRKTTLVPATAYCYLDALSFVEGSSAASYFDGASGTASDGHYTTTTHAWTGTANNSTSTETATTVTPYATATQSLLPYLPPVAYLSILGATHDIKVSRQELNVGTLTATILDSSLDPAQSGIIRPGKPVRLRALVSESGVWSTVFAGKVVNGAVTYELKDPETPDRKRSRITLTATDALTTLANTARAEGVATIAELPFVLEGGGVPWSTNGSGNQVPTAAVVTRNDNTSMLDQVSVTRDSVLGYAWLSRNGVLQVWDADKIPTAVTALADETYYTDFVADFDMARVINEVTVTLNRFNLATGEVVSVPYGPYVDAESVNRWGRFSSEFTVQGLSESSSGAAIQAYAQKILDANANPQVQVKSIKTAVLRRSDFSADVGSASNKVFLDLFDLVTVSNYRAEINETYRVTSIEHTIDPTSWTVDIGFAADGSVASPQLTPAPSTGSGAITDGTWITPVLVGGWINYGSTWEPAGYMRKGGVVYIRGFIKSGTATVGTTIFTLPVGYRPGSDTHFDIVSNGLHGVLNVFADGRVVTNVSISATWVSLRGLIFPADA